MTLSISIVSIADTQHSNTQRPQRFWWVSLCLLLIWRHNTQHNNSLHSDTKHEGIISDIQHNDIQHNISLPNKLYVIKLNVIMQSVIAPLICWVLFFECPCSNWHYAECHYAECHYAECHYAECQYAVMLSVIMLLCWVSLCCYAECHYAECHYAECRGTEGLRWSELLECLTSFHIVPLLHSKVYSIWPHSIRGDTKKYFFQWRHNIHYNELDN